MRPRARDSNGTHLMSEAAASRIETDTSALNRRAVLRRLAATSAVAWAAPEVLATKRASAAALSGCYTEFDFDDGTLQGWLANNARAAGWQVSSVHSYTGGFSAWFGHATAHNSLYPVLGEPSYRQGRHPQRGTLTSAPGNVAATDVVCFNVRLAIESATNFDVFRFWIVQGAARVQLWDKTQGGFTVIDHPEDPSGPYDLYTTEAGWNHYEITIGTPPAIDLNSPVQFEFDFQTVDGFFNRTEGIYLDNIVLPCSGVATGTAGTGIPNPRKNRSTLEAPANSGFLPGYQPPPAVEPTEQRE